MVNVRATCFVRDWMVPPCLLRYTAHADGAVRACARDALMGIVRGCPTLRGPVLANMAAFLAAIPDDAVQVGCSTSLCVVCVLQSDGIRRTPCMCASNPTTIALQKTFCLANKLALSGCQRIPCASADGGAHTLQNYVVIPTIDNSQVACSCCCCHWVQVTRECLLLLRMFMELWLSLLQEQRLSSSLINPAVTADGSRQPRAEQLFASSSQDASATTAAALGTEASIGADPACFTHDLHRLEGVFFMLLCSFDESIRLDAYSALGLLRTLHQELLAMAEQLGVQPGNPAQQQQQQPGAGAVAGACGGSFSSASTLTASIQPDGSAAAAGTPPASSVASAPGSGMFFRHKPTASRDSAEFMQTLGGWCRGGCSHAPRCKLCCAQLAQCSLLRLSDVEVFICDAALPCPSTGDSPALNHLCTLTTTTCQVWCAMGPV